MDTQDRWWDNGDAVVGAGQSSAPQRAPGSISRGPKPMAPGEAERLEFTRRADARAAEDQDRQARNENRGTIPAGFERKPDGSIAPMVGFDPKKATKANEGEMKAASFLTRALGSNISYEKTGVGARSMPGQFLHENAPGISNTLFNSNERQVADSAQDEFIAATLRQDSGAAIPEAELERQRRIYFPMPGDREDVIAQKRAARLRALAGLKEAAGTALGDGQSAILKKYEPDIAAAMRGENSTEAGEKEFRFNDEERPVTGYRFSTEQEAKIAEALRTGDEGQTLALLRSYSGNAPTEQTIASVRTKLKELHRNPQANIGFDYGSVDKAAHVADEKEKFGDYLEPAMRERKGLVVDPFIRGVADVVPFSDEIAATGNTIFGGGTYADNIRKERAIDEADSRVNSGGRITGQLTGATLPVGRVLGFGLTGGLARSAASYGAEGAATSALYAAGKADPSPDATMGESLAARAYQAPLGALIGGSTAYGLSRAAQAMASRGGPPRLPKGDADLARAADEEGVQISRPIIDPSRRSAMAYLESSLGSGEPVRRSLKATLSDIASRVGELGSGGTVQEAGVLGTIFQDAGRRFIERSRDIGSRLYNRAAQLAGGRTVEGREALAVIDRNIAELSQNENTNAPLIKYMKEVRADLAKGDTPIPKTVAAFRDLRTQLRGQISTRNLTATDAERRMGEVLDAARTDITRDLSSDAPAAVRQYVRADKFWGERHAEIKQVVSTIIGPKDNPIGGEKVFERIKALAGPRGDSLRLERMWAKLEPHEQADAAATIAETLGRRSPGEEFSPTLFVNSVRALSPPALRTIFGDEGAKSINNLRSLSEALRDTTGSLNNSRSGQVLQWGTFLRNMLPSSLAGGGGALAGGPIGAVASGALVAGGGMAARNLSARALMSPNMSRWLKNAGQATSPTKIQKSINALSVVARLDPVIAQDVLGLQRKLQEAFAQTPLRATATDQKSGRGPVPVEIR